jgi:hypothetical protein
MKLTEKEEKIARLALDPGAKEGEKAAAALKLIESLKARGITVEDIQEAEVHTEYVYSDPPPPPRPHRRDAPWDPDPEVRRRNYEAADAAGYQWDRQYGNGYEYSAPQPTAEQEEAMRQYTAECERIEREEALKEAARVAEAQAQARARQAAWDAIPGYRKFAIGLGALLGPYSRFSWDRLFSAPRETTAWEAKFNEIFAHVLIVVVGLTVISGVVALFFH